MNDRIAKVMARAFEVLEADIKENTTQDTIENWDSLHHVKMIVYLEREFDIAIPDEEVGNMTCYNLIERVVHECLKP
jgi:acyl carrier protein